MGCGQSRGKSGAPCLEPVHITMYVEPHVDDKSHLHEESYGHEKLRADNFELRGVTIDVFRSLRKEALRRNCDPDYWTMGRLSAELIGNHEIMEVDSRFGAVDPASTLTYRSRKSFIDCLQTHGDKTAEILGLDYSVCVNAKANVFLSFAYGNNFIELVDALEAQLEERAKLEAGGTERVDGEIFFWFDMLVNDQWRAMQRDFEWWSTTFRTAVQSIGETMIFLSPWHSPSMLTRAWCLYEISCSNRLSVAISRKQREEFCKTLREDFDSIIASLCVIDLEKASAWLKEDQDRIFEVVGGMDGGFHVFNVQIVGMIRKWVAQSARQMVEEVGEGAVGEQLADLIRTAILLGDQGELEEAKAMYEHALAGYEKSLGINHPDTLDTIHNFAALLSGQNKLEEAKTMYEKALAGKEKRLGVDHPKTLMTVNNLANLLSDQDKLEEAKAMYVRALAGYEKSLGVDHPDTLDTMNNLAALLSDQGKLEEAKTMYEKALAGKEKRLGVDHPKTLMTVNNLANLLSDQDKLEEAKAMYVRALAGYEKSLGVDHPDTLDTMNNLAAFLGEQGEPEEAKAMYEKALAGYEKRLGVDHPDTLDILSRLTVIRRELDNQDSLL